VTSATLPVAREPFALLDEGVDPQWVARIAVVDPQLEGSVAELDVRGQPAARHVKRAQLAIAQRRSVRVRSEQDLRSQLLWDQRSPDAHRQHERSRARLRAVLQSEALLKPIGSVAIELADGPVPVEDLVCRSFRRHGSYALDALAAPDGGEGKAERSLGHAQAST
jgi:hypothetical protein